MKNRSKKIWIDIINPSDSLFFNSIIKEFDKSNIFVTLRDRAETVQLAKSFGINGKIVGKDYRDKTKKIAAIILRTLQLLKIPNFDVSLSFENGMAVAVSKIRRKKAILFCDNDLKFLQKESFVQDLETKFKSTADVVIVPEACAENFEKFFGRDKVVFYNGYKEDVYIADYIPDPGFVNKIPFDRYVVIRPESLGSLYVLEKHSLVPELLKLFEKEGINVVYLPREKEDAEFAKGFGAYIPPKALNGLDLCYYSDAVLTGSGTMAREAACMGKPAVSFFPGTRLLSVDRKLIEEGKMLHSRDAKEIVEYVIKNFKNKRKQKLDTSRSKSVKREVMKILYEIIKGGCLHRETSDSFL